MATCIKNKKVSGRDRSLPRRQVRRTAENNIIERRKYGENIIETEMYGCREQTGVMYVHWSKNSSFRHHTSKNSFPKTLSSREKRDKRKDVMTGILESQKEIMNG